MPNATQTEFAAILHGAAIAPLETNAFLRITGSDATRWLNGMVTNSIQSLAPGEGCYNFLLNAQGRILADCTIYRDTTAEPSFLMATGNGQLETIRTHLDHFIIMDDVELAPAHTDDTSLLLLGPDAPRLLASLGLPAPEPLRLAHAGTPHGSVLLLTPAAAIATSVPRFELYADTNTIANLQAELLTARASMVSADSLELLRILEARPLYGRDITDKYLPQETNQPHALHFAKGCYLGQEIVERIRSRGQVHRLLTPLTLTGSLPAELPAPLHSATDANARSAGEITSAALIPLSEGPQLLALGYVRREALEGPQATHQPLTYSGGSAAPRSLPSTPASNSTEPTHA